MKKNRWKFVIGTACLLSLTSISLPVFATSEMENNYTNEYYELKGFEGVDLVTEDEYEEVSPTTSKEMGEAEMGSSSKAIMARASSWVWKNENGMKQFYDGEGKLMYGKDSKYVIDVSEHNGTIDWEKVKAAGVDGAIIRVGWGYLGRDTQFKRNISECNRLGIPYGVYLYSYAYDANFALSEAKGTVEMLKEADINLSYPLYYDIEHFTPWNDGGITRKPPTDVATYEKIIGTYIQYMSEHGYAGKVHVYSYRSYLNDVLNSPSIHAYTSWAAEYGPKLNFTNKHYGGEQGWQYTSDGSVDGIKGRVDLNCFSDQFYNTLLSTDLPDNLKEVFANNGVYMKEGYLYGIKLGTDLSELTSKLSEIGEVAWLNKEGIGISGGSVATGQLLKVTITSQEVEENSLGKDMDDARIDDKDAEKKLTVEDMNSEEVVTTVETYTLAVVEKGDVDGDGKIRSIDYALIKNDILNIKKLNGAFMYAGDIDGDGKIRSIDYALVKNDILNIKKIEQK